MFKTGKEIRRAYLSILVLSIIGIVLGLWFSLITVINPTPEYDDMLEGTVKVDSIIYISHYRGGGHYELKTLDGEFYILSGKFYISDLQDNLPKGTEIQIKWYSKNWLFQKKLYIQEIKLCDELLSTYTNNNQVHTIVGFVGGGIIVAMGIGGILLYRHFINKELIKLPKKRR